VYISDLALTDFRSYENAVLRFEPGVNVLVGLNGQGKTNVVEAIYYLSTLASHRVSFDGALVRQGASQAVIRSKIVRGDRSVLVDIELGSGKQRKARVNRAPVSRAREILGLCRTVIFAPEDLVLVKGDPDARRRFLDDLVVQLSPRMAGLYADYDKVVRQRNALLKTAARSHVSSNESLSTLDSWDEHAAAFGSEIISARLEALHDLEPRVAAAYSHVSSAQSLAHVSYKSSIDEESPLYGGDPSAAEIKERLLDAMRALRGKELERGMSLVGPQRDDLLLRLGDLPAKGYASHGESWSLALALRLASFEILKERHDDDPILLLDDVFAELDAQRRTQLSALVAATEQVIITAAVGKDVPKELSVTTFHVSQGEVTRDGE
jgi:DNA replication and repair protein RecF